MSNKRWQKVSEILDTLLPLPHEDQVTYLETNYGNDAELVEEVKLMLKSISASKEENFLESSEENKAAIFDKYYQTGGPSRSLKDNVIGEQVGPYQIEEFIAEGGMGSVYKAERNDGQFQQTVAIKFISHRNFNESIKLRFRQEQKILAGLNHPNIARLLDGGITKQGFPYFIMEYIEGTPIDEYCNKHQFSTKQRLKIFKKVLSVIDYAHTKLVVHRDLKPSNILVTHNGTIKILDFGIAKLLDDDTGEHALLTQTGQRLWTPHYAAPEQVLEKPPQLQTDIYSLGILQYLLLAGHTPFDFENKGIHEVEKTILEEKPLSMSEIVAKHPEFPFKQYFGESRIIIQKTLKHELDAIAAKAIRKEPDRRYSSVSIFMNDLEHYQNNFAVSAVRDNFLYSSRKFILRNKRTLTTAVVVLGIIGSVVTFYTTQLNQERRAAEAEARKANHVSSYLSSLFSQNYPENAQGEDITASQLLAEGVEQLGSLEGQPEVQTAMLNLFANIYHNIEELEIADSLANEAIKVYETHDLNAEKQMASAWHTLALVERDRGNYAQSIAYFNRSLELEGLTNTAADSNYASRLSSLAYVLRLNNDLDKAAEKNKEAINIQRRLYGETNINLAESLYIQASILRVLGRFEEALQYQLDSFNMVKELVTPPHPGLSANLSNLALLMEKTGDFSAAEEYSRRSLAMNIELHGEGHTMVANSLRNVASSLNAQGKHQEALNYLERSLELANKYFNKNHLQRAYSYHDLGNTYIKLNQLDKADSLLKGSLNIKQASLGEKHLSISATYNNLAELEKRRGNPDSAYHYLQKSHQIRKEILGTDHTKTKEVRNLMDQLNQ